MQHLHTTPKRLHDLKIGDHVLFQGRLLEVTTAPIVSFHSADLSVETTAFCESKVISVFDQDPNCCYLGLNREWSFQGNHLRHHLDVVIK